MSRCLFALAATVHRRAATLMLVLAVLGPDVAHAARSSIREHAEGDPVWLFRRGLPMEQESDAPSAVGSAKSPAQRLASTINFGRFTIRQVNVSGLGNDILNDAANEPSIAVDPNNHNRMAIGWRQFANVASNFREAGYGYTTNGGVTWTAGKFEAGTFRSDPVLGVDGAGNFLYNSLRGDFYSYVFHSTNGGVTWGSSTFAYGGDKQWMAVDRDLGYGYQVWSIAGNNYFPNDFNRTLNNAAAFLAPTVMADQPIWGTVATAKDHSVYVVGWGTDGNDFTGDLRVLRSDDAQNPDQVTVPTWSSYVADIGGFVNAGPPNPAGLLGQAWIAVDRSEGAYSGWVYVLSSVITDTDSVDVHFIRSTDRGATWSAPVRVNDDIGTRAFQWFGTMSVSPGGRIDAVWLDSRGSTDSTMNALFYSYSTDGGSTWAANEQVSPVFNVTLGYPNQAKIGDYYTMVSDDEGADVAFSATFNGGEDVYYVRIPNTTLPVGVGDRVAGPARLRPNLPNPFSGSTTLRFDAPAQGGRVRLEIFDISGKRVRTLVDGFRSGADQEVTWDARRSDGQRVAPGVYLCRLEVDGVTATRRMLSVR